MNVIFREIRSEFNDAIVYEKLDCTVEGPCLFLVVDMEPLEVKSKTIEIEDGHPIGRLADLDVYNLQGTALSRTELELAPRKCYICGDIAHNCVRSKRHSNDEVINYINSKNENYKLFFMSTPKVINSISKHDS